MKQTRNCDEQGRPLRTLRNFNAYILPCQLRLPPNLQHPHPARESDSWSNGDDVTSTIEGGWTPWTAQTPGRYHTAGHGEWGLCVRIQDLQGVPSKLTGGRETVRGVNGEGSFVVYNTYPTASGELCFDVIRRYTDMG